MAAKLLLLFHTADSNCIKNHQICYIGIKSMSIQPHPYLLHTVRTKAKAICPISAPSVTQICPGTAHRCETTCSVFFSFKNFGYRRKYTNFAPRTRNTLSFNAKKTTASTVHRLLCHIGLGGQRPPQTVHVQPHRDGTGTGKPTSILFG